MTTLKSDLVLFFKEFLASTGMFMCFFGLSPYFEDDHYLSWYVVHFLLVVMYDHITVQATMNPSFQIANYVAGLTGFKATVLAVVAQFLGAGIGFAMIDHHFPDHVYHLISCPPAHDDLGYAFTVEMLATLVCGLEVYSTLYLLPNDRFTWICLLAATLRILMMIGDSVGVNVVMNSMVGVACVLKDVPMHDWGNQLLHQDAEDYLNIYVFAPTVGAVLAAVLWFPIEHLLVQRARAEASYAGLLEPRAVIPNGHAVKNKED